MTRALLVIHVYVVLQPGIDHFRVVLAALRYGMAVGLRSTLACCLPIYKTGIVDSDPVPDERLANRIVGHVGHDSVEILCADFRHVRRVGE